VFHTSARISPQLTAKALGEQAPVRAVNASRAATVTRSAAVLGLRCAQGLEWRKRAAATNISVTTFRHFFYIQQFMDCAVL